MLTLALTGGIGSGKSFVASIWQELGAHVVDADQVAREIVEPGTPALEKITERWGSAVIGDDGRLDRATMAQIVFSNEAERKALNAMTHQAVARKVRDRLGALRKSEPSGVVVYDVPLLVGQPNQFAMTANVAVSACEKIRIERLMNTRGMSEEEAQARINSQATDEDRASIADVVIVNEASAEELRKTAIQIWQTWIVPFRDQLATGTFVDHALQENARVFYQTESELQVRRLSALGVDTLRINTADEAGTLVLSGRTENLDRAGWIQQGNIWRHANPALDLQARVSLPAN
ncbi:dephospho-CoA kinase [Trueperella bonasi]|uniref:Dephospho-CoA kinase n=1 Tax=Trueperella bonasi TaxID=312286 RepID=A0ABT9NE77_9ACTO|nr:dephospho-CoA kinase [Trueperella bonasi]MDP9805497.1 dephospho-CoA kinase [Trueperella bonasi]